jgi:hypothetical protein
MGNKGMAQRAEPAAGFNQNDVVPRHNQDASTGAAFGISVVADTT